MTRGPHETPAPTRPEPADRPLVTIVCNILLPALILSKLSAEGRLGPKGALATALAFPIGYFIYDYWRRRRIHPVAILGFVSILLTGSIGLMHLDSHWFAIKEATMPTLMGLAVVISQWTKKPLVRTMLYNDKVIDTARVDAELTARGHMGSFERLLATTTWMLAAAFLVSAGLNFTLSTIIVKSPAGTVAFNEELGRMTAIAYPVVVVPCLLMTLAALWRLVAGIRQLTGLGLEAIFRQAPTPSESASK